MNPREAAALRNRAARQRMDRERAEYADANRRLAATADVRAGIKPFFEERQLTVARMWANGQTLRAIADKLGYRGSSGAASALYRVVTTLGVTSPVGSTMRARRAQLRVALDDYELTSLTRELDLARADRDLAVQREAEWRTERISYENKVAELEQRRRTKEAA